MHEELTTLQALAAKKTGPMPSGRTWRTLPVPHFFQEATAESFVAMDMKADDVVCSSSVKAGTSWLHKILILMLHGIDDAGVMTSTDSEVITALRKAQVYPDAVPMERPAEPLSMPAGGMLTFGDLCAQPSPRLFTTHLHSKYLPSALTDPTAGRGRLIVCMRNPKDVLTSLHFFRGEAKDGWRGNEHGPGSLARFCSPSCPNAYGSYFEWVRQTDATTKPLLASNRCLVVYYEHMKENLPSQLDRISTFLSGSPLSEAKRAALVRAVSLDGMAGHITIRKGEIGDWKNHLNKEAWALVDETIAETIAETELYKPLKPFAEY